MYNYRYLHYNFCIYSAYIVLSTVDLIIEGGEADLFYIIIKFLIVALVK